MFNLYNLGTTTLVHVIILFQLQHWQLNEFLGAVLVQRLKKAIQIEKDAERDIENLCDCIDCTYLHIYIYIHNIMHFDVLDN